VTETSRGHQVLASADSRVFASLRSRPSSRADRYALGKELRHEVPRSSLARWAPPPDRADPVALLEELDAVEKAGVPVGDRLLISDRAHLILPYHRSHEAAAEQARGVDKLGTTAKGIGPS